MRPRISPVITRIALRLVLIMAVGAVTASCGYQLCYDHPHTGQLRVVFDWRDAPGAAPQSMSLYLFPTKGDGGCLTTKVRQSLFYTQNLKIQAAFATPDIDFG